MSSTEVSEKLRKAVNRQRLLDTAERLVAVPSPTGTAGKAADCLAALLASEGFTVERPVAGHPAAPAVVVRFDSGRPGRTLQFDGHLDTVHLPFVPPKVIDGQLTGSGASDMKAGLAAAVEALFVLRDTNSLPGGAILLVAHDLHEAPWGLGQQLNALIASGIHGDAVLIPEPLSSELPIAGRGSAAPGAAVHEVMRPLDEPNVISAGADLVCALAALSEKLSQNRHPVAGTESVFVGQIHSGEIYNQYPQECWLEGTRRWLPRRRRLHRRARFPAIGRRCRGATPHGGRKSNGALCAAHSCWATNDPLVSSFQNAYSQQCGHGTGLRRKALCRRRQQFLVSAPLVRRPRAGHHTRAAGRRPAHGQRMGFDR